MSFDDPKFFVALGMGLWNIALTVAIWLRKPGEEAKSAIDSFSAKLGKVDSDVRVMQETLKHLPTGDEITGMKEDMASMKSDNRAQTDLLRIVQQQLNRIDDYLRSNH